MRSCRWLILAAGIVLAVLLFVPALIRGRERTPPNRCLANLHMLVLALRMYAADTDGSLPVRDRWVSCLVPSYISQDDPLKCPNDRSRGRCSYGMNSRLSAWALARVKDDGEAVLLYETGNPRDNPFGGPRDVADPPRHGWGNHYGYLDGSARVWREPPSFVIK